MLRRLKKEDAKYMIEWMHDPQIIYKYKTDFMKYTELDALDFIEHSFSEDNIHFAVVNCKDEYIGTVSLKNISYYNLNAECTSAFRTCATDVEILSALNEIKEYAFLSLKLKEVYAHVYEDDIDNIRFLEKNGYIKGGTYIGKRLNKGKYHSLCWYFIRNIQTKSIDEHEMLQFSEKGDDRGHLVVVEQFKDVPFSIKRLFYIYGSSSEVVRGKHANRNSEFVLINVAGNSKVKVFDGKKEVIYSLDHPHKGVYLPRMVWKEMYDFSPDAVLLVLASECYDESEYIRDYTEFLNEIRQE